MQIFHYDHSSGLYLGAGTADPSPKETGKYLVPAFACTDAPPTPAAGQQVRRVEDAWVVEDVPHADV